MENLCTVEIHSHLAKEGELPFFARDAVDLLYEQAVPEDIIEIKSLTVKEEDRCKGIGSALLQEKLKELQDNYVFTVVGERTEEQKESLSREVFERLDSFYHKNKFICVNALIGEYSEKAVYMYTGNEKGKQFLLWLVEYANRIADPNCVGLPQFWKDLNRAYPEMVPTNIKEKYNWA